MKLVTGLNSDKYAHARTQYDTTRLVPEQTIETLEEIEHLEIIKARSGRTLLL